MYDLVLPIIASSSCRWSKPDLFCLVGQLSSDKLRKTIEKLEMLINNCEKSIEKSQKSTDFGSPEINDIYRAVLIALRQYEKKQPTRRPHFKVVKNAG